MIDVLAAISLASAAAASENPSQLFADCETLYSFYVKARGDKVDIQELAASGQLKPLIDAAARVMSVASHLASNPNHLKSLTDLLGSI